MIELGNDIDEIECRKTVETNDSSSPLKPKEKIDAFLNKNREKESSLNPASCKGVNLKSTARKIVGSPVIVSAAPMPVVRQTVLSSGTIVQSTSSKAGLSNIRVSILLLFDGPLISLKVLTTLRHRSRN